MASIERTAYPRFSQQLSDQELDARYGPTSNSRSNIIRYSINFKNQKKLLSRTVTSRPKSIDIQVDIFQTAINTQKDKVSLDFTA